MLKIDGKTFMNIQEAVQWLLENNALPYQSSANYVANTEIGLGTIVNPTPAKVRIGSLIFFADSKVSTVIGLTENGFICSDQYNNLVDDVAYVTNVAINASGHLITTMSDGQTIDAGIIKQVSYFTINASQHLVAYYNDGTNSDLGAIFTGNINISGTLNATNITGNSIIETMTDYSFSQASMASGLTWEAIYSGIVKNGNKLTFVIAGNITRTATVENVSVLGQFSLPSAVHGALYPTLVGADNLLDVKQVNVFSDKVSSVSIPIYTKKLGFGNAIQIEFAHDTATDLVLNTKYYVRYEVTFLLSTNLAS